MSISAQGRSRLNCVCRWRSGFCSEAAAPRSTSSRARTCASTRPRRRRLSAAFASRQTSRIDSAFLTTGLCATRTGIAASASSAARDLARVLVHLPEHLVPVELLAPGQEPDLVRRRAPSVAIRGDPDRGRSLLIGFPHGGEAAREDRLGRVGGRLRRVGDRRRVGRDRRGGVARRDARRGRRRGHVLRHRGRLRGRALRAPDRAPAAGARRAARTSRPSSEGRAPLDPGLYTYENLRGWLERSRENLGVETVDLVQLHCPPWETYYMPEVHEACDTARAGRASSAPTASASRRSRKALKAIEYDGVATIQIIFNMLRQRPAELFFAEAEAA